MRLPPLKVRFIDSYEAQKQELYEDEVIKDCIAGMSEAFMGMLDVVIGAVARETVHANDSPVGGTETENRCNDENPD